MKNHYTILLLIITFVFTSFIRNFAQINLDSVRIIDNKPPKWKIGAQFQVGLQTLGLQQLNQELQARDYRAFNPMDMHFGFNFMLSYLNHGFGIGGFGYRNFNGDNFYITQFNFGLNYQYTFLKKKSLEFMATGAAYVSVLELRAIRPDPQFFPYSILYTFPVNGQIGIGVDKCTGFKGIFGRSKRLDVRIGARLGYSFPFTNQWNEGFNNSQPVNNVPMVNSNGFLYLKFVVTSLIPVGG